MRIRRATLVLLAAAITAGCAGEPSIDELSAGSSAATATGRIVATLEALGPPPGPPRPAPIEIPTSALDFFRAQESLCEQYAHLAGVGKDIAPPPVEKDRFRRSILLRELDRDTALIEDGRGTRLLVDQWTTMGIVLPSSARREDVMSAPYRLGCSPDVFVGTSG